MIGPEPIAIVGSACRFPGESDSPSKLWALLRQPKDVQKEFPAERWNVNAFYHPDHLHHGTANVRHSYFLDQDLRHFDAHFFGINPVETIPMDPQHRLLLEVVYEGMEAAGLKLSQLRGTETGVYVGSMSADYGDLITSDPDSMPTYFATGTARSMLANRVSYFFDWNGPSMSIDTACSSSLVAVHEAVQLLRSGGGSDVAVAAGTNLMLHPYLYIGGSRLQMLSPDGRSRMWDEKANGYARGEGVGVVILKRLSKAIEDGDHIQSIIRETSVNQDGRTPGITMPSPVAQTNLIKATYAKAGLDLSKSAHRPQYIEAHGTGTPTGDPLEAEALHTAFFKGVEGSFSPIHVGSIKSVIGHTEGSAGLAGLLKASLAIQHRVIPPNFLFDRLNPRIEPFYGDLQILSNAQAWPALDPGAVPRASVNCFGFGGTNAHAILEGYDSELEKSTTSLGMLLIPSLNFSAATDTALQAMLQRYADFLSSNTDVNLHDLAWTLNTRRSTFAVRTSVSGHTLSELVEGLKAKATAGQKTLLPLPAIPLPSRPKLLGIFTGQGAQWARMSAKLLLEYPVVSSIIDRLEESLTQLSDRPSWSLRDELLAEAETSHIHEASISQPLCTAVQIVIVTLLRAAGIVFDTVIGHSSGEIAAAYACGYLSGTDAIRIAYYRGYHLDLARGANEAKGAMMAAGLSFSEAEELCNLHEFAGRISIAAYNSPTSVTLSGDADAIENAVARLGGQMKFVRVLKVDKAYHSHHMLPVVEAYRRSLADCKISVQSPQVGTSWISTVERDDMANRDLNDEYWIDNMVNPVYFAHALDLAAGKGTYHVAIECGPHPALKGPALQVLQDKIGHTIPYTGALARGKDDTQAFAECLSYVWQALGENSVNYEDLTRFLAGPDVTLPQVISYLPAYPWDHDRIFWHEPRPYAVNRIQTEPPHELLGVKCPDGMEQQLRWKNVLRPKEMEWLDGHQLQGQTVFPAAAYVCSAIEAARFATKGITIKTIGIEDLVIEQGMTFDEKNSSVETQFTLTEVTTDQGSWKASFAFYFVTPNDPLALARCASGKIFAVVGEEDEDALPGSPESEFNMSSIETDQFYNWLESFNLVYTGIFRRLSSLNRKSGVATGCITNPSQTDPGHSLLLHPATLDNAFQSIYLAHCYPGDGRFWTLHVPVSIRRIIINPLVCRRYAGKEATLRFRSTIPGDNEDWDGDADIYDENGVNTLVQVEGIHIKPLAPPSKADDTSLFFKTVWNFAEPTLELSKTRMPDLEPHAEFFSDRERVALYYLRKLDKNTTRLERESAEPHIKIFFECIDYITSIVRNGTTLLATSDWLDDTPEKIQAIIDKYPDGSLQGDDFVGLRMLGEALPRVVRGEIKMIEYMMENDMVDGFYGRDIPFREYSKALADQADQLAHRYPNMNILEIGAGTGGTTEYVLKKLGKRFASYMYTDISVAFFAKARELFQEFDAKMSYKALDITIDPVKQGYKEHSYDFIICSLVLHATPNMERTLKNVRRLLKPGGYLLMLELVERPDQVIFRSTVILGALPGWWLGYESGRTLSPAMMEEQWDECLKNSGFSGIEAYIPRPEVLPISFAVITSRAVNEYVEFLRNPAGPCPGQMIGSHLTIVGGSTGAVNQIISESLVVLRPYYSDIQVIKSLSELSGVEVPFMGTVLCLADVDQATFQDLSANTLKGMQQLFQLTKTCLWVTLGARSSNPYHNMSIGLCRTVREEMPHMRLQCLDFDTVDNTLAKAIPTILLQLEAIDYWLDNSLMMSNQLLWSIEPELLYKNGTVIIPRLIQDNIRNDRYNSSRRRITRDANPTKSVLELRKLKKGFGIYQVASTPSYWCEAGGKSIDVDVSYSTLHAVQLTKTTYAYLILGTCREDQKRVFALSLDRWSAVQVPRDLIIPCDVTLDVALQLMPVIPSYLAALQIISRQSGSMLILLEPKKDLAAIFAELAYLNGVNLLILTSQPHIEGKNCVRIHPSTPRRVIQPLIPKEVSCMIVCTTDLRLTANVTACLPPTCEIRGPGALVSEMARLDRNSDDYACFRSFLQSAFHFASLRHAIEKPIAMPPIISASELAMGNLPSQDDTTVFSWIETENVPVEITPVDSQFSLDPDKSYWMVGLTGGLGLSLCEWMVKHGARHLVLTSRNPDVDFRWQEHMKALGAIMSIWPCDVTDSYDVQNTYDRIYAEHPPIGGVAHGAMVLKDAAFADMDIEAAQKVIEPKVKGAIHLDKLFSSPGNELDFFIAFSSITAVIGNKGQALYSAANCFLPTLIAQRKKKGLVGSVIDISSVLGAGYITRQSTALLQDHLNQTGIRYMAESDFHQLFTEAVISGREQSDDDHIPEITTGLQSVRLEDAPKATWVTNWRFSHCLALAEDENTSGLVPLNSVSVKAQLAVATTVGEVRQAIEDGFTAKLRAALLLDESVPLLDQRGQDLSLDSLIGVDLRSWFMKELKVDIAVMKILSGSTMREVVDLAVEKVPEGLVPMWGKGENLVQQVQRHD
ncbi:ketoacyl-synt-domain-containing protein [Delitschia confertaspora ATCC 74209]|uniref:Ketoacyl-synt-domain-containing protein n=1 Tax=Delitschia confertaspora ATCC 74209 TaxID=1513339 RepID=A0A9P4JC11_9PLEO|nr:ketoacyl-synt-domain-containing protein [Delitschia confertaspora ATCC 74209]